MRLCHPPDCLLDVTAHGFVVRARCHAPGCGRVYGVLMPRAQRRLWRAWLSEGVQKTTWATWGSVTQLVNEMRCLDDVYCAACAAGRPLTACEGRHA